LGSNLWFALPIIKDDGPGQDSIKVINDLGNVNFKSTFFVVGQNVLITPEPLLAV
jgi:hypothetical protein